MRLTKLRQRWATGLLLITWFVQVMAFAVLAPQAHAVDHGVAHTIESNPAPDHHAQHLSATQPLNSSNAQHSHAMSNGDMSNGGMPSGGDSEDCCADVEQCAFNHCLQAALLPEAVIFPSINFSLLILDAGSAPVTRSSSLYRPPILA